MRFAISIEYNFVVEERRTLCLDCRRRSLGGLAVVSSGSVLSQAAFSLVMEEKLLFGAWDAANDQFQQARNVTLTNRKFSFNQDLFS